MKRIFPVCSITAVVLMAIAAFASVEWVATPQPARGQPSGLRPCS